MNTRTSLKYIVLLFIGFTISGCAELGRQLDTAKPTAKLLGTRLTKLDFEQVNLVLDMAVTNKNPFSIPLEGLDYDLKIGGNSLVSGVTGQGLKVKRSSTSKIALPVTLKFDDLRKIPGELWKKDQFDYQLDTSINIKLPVIGLYSIPIRKQGTLPVPKLPRIQVRDLNVSELSLTAAKIVAEIEVDNPNDFDLGLSNFNYRLDINQSTWGEGTSSKPGSIPKKGKGTIQIPLQLDLMNMGKTAYQLLSSDDKIDYQLLGGITLDTGIDLLRQYKMPLNLKGTTRF